jgi:hypothetical protein
VGSRLFGVEAERLELSTPFCRRIAKALNADATGQATFYGCFDKVRCELGPVLRIRPGLDETMRSEAGAVCWRAVVSSEEGE